MTTHPVTAQSLPADVLSNIRHDFPILNQKINQQPLIYFDNAATTQKPQSVIDHLQDYYATQNANVHRGVHYLSDQTTTAFEDSRKKVQAFIHASKVEEIIWTRGTTEAINLVAYSYGLHQLKAGDDVLISAMEHHANIVPWQMVCERTQANLKIIPVSSSGDIELDAYHDLLSESTKLVAINHVSNALGSVNPIKPMIDAAHKTGAVVLIDGAQAAPHLCIDVAELDCDFYTFSGHKCFAPTGIGVLYGKESLLEKMPPFQLGGEMIEQVSFEKTTYNQLPYKFEAGTPHIAGAIGLGVAIDYLNHHDFAQLQSHEAHLLSVAHRMAEADPDIQLIGTASEKVGVMSFLLKGSHPHDVGTLLDKQGIALRTGHHCAMPIMQQFNIPGTVRASFSFYNTEDEIIQLFKAINKVKSFL